MNITRQAATITHIALMLASGVSRIGVASAAPATPGRTSEAIAATGPAIRSLFFIDFLLARRSTPRRSRLANEAKVRTGRRAVFRRLEQIPGERFSRMERRRLRLAIGSGDHAIPTPADGPDRIRCAPRRRSRPRAAARPGAAGGAEDEQPRPGP